MNCTTSKLASAAFISLILPLYAIAAPKVVIEAPEDGSTQSGIIQIYGWASDDFEITSVELQVDDASQTAIKIGYGASRKDVQRAYPDDHDPEYSGYSTAFHTKLLNNGLHRITITATNEVGERKSVSRTFYVSNTPESEKVYDEIDLSMASAVISGSHIYLDGVILNGRVYNNLELKFDKVTNGFRLSHFDDDLDRDGFADDDLDHDGYHDDDRDRDGFHDDDHDRDGHSDRDCSEPGDQFDDSCNGTDDSGSDDTGSDDRGPDDCSEPGDQFDDSCNGTDDSGADNTGSDDRGPDDCSEPGDQFDDSCSGMNS